MKRVATVFGAVILAASGRLAAADEQFVEFAPTATNFQIVRGIEASVIFVDQTDWEGVGRAAIDLREDINRVTGKMPLMTRDKQMESGMGSNAIIVGTIGKSPIIDRLIKEGKLDVKDVAGKWESYVVQTVKSPMEGTANALVIAGSDKRGAIFGTYELSRQIGVSPWYWWADVPPIHHDALFVKAGRFAQGEPAVKYRGIFFNDEAPALTHYVYEKYGSFNHEFYGHVFELLLRLKGNYLWPAMWQARTGIQEPAQGFHADDSENGKTADMYGIVMGTSHHEPMTRSQKEWKILGTDFGGVWNYQTNEAGMKAFWSGGIEKTRNFENVITMGMRGDGDMAMPSAGSTQANIALLEKIVADQRKILVDKINPDITKIPQLWCLYTEVQSYYDNGMRVPDDVTLLWCDDNWGNIRRLPTPGERNRSGGAGVYFHFDLVGQPRAYKWINTNPLPRVWEQMTQALEYGADRLWVVNVGDLKPLEYPISFFLQLAYDGKKLDKERLSTFPTEWATRQFGPAHAAEIGDLVTKYSKYAGRRKPELIEAGTYSLVNYNEWDTIVGEYKSLVTKAEEIAKTLPKESQDAFFQLVLHQPKAQAILTELYESQAKNQLYITQGRASASDFAARVRELYKADADLTDAYHKLNNGKWNHFMDQAHFGYTGWQEPRPVQIMPAVRDVSVPDAPAMGVAVEGATAVDGDLALPVIDTFNRQKRWIEVFNKGRSSFDFTAKTGVPWILLNTAGGKIEKESRFSVSIDWDKVPQGKNTGTIILSALGGERTIKVEAFNPTEITPKTLKGYVEAEGVVSIAPDHFSRKIDAGNVHWDKIEDFGIYSNGMTIFPMTAASVSTPGANSPCLEYQIYTFSAGPAEILTQVAPTLDYANRGIRLAISIDDQPPQILNAVAGRTGANNLPADWTQSVTNAVRTFRSSHSIAAPGYHTLKVWMVDPGIVVEKIVVNLGGLRPSYLGPPESFRGTAP